MLNAEELEAAVGENAVLRQHAQRGARLKEQCEQLLERLKAIRAERDCTAQERNASQDEAARLQQRVSHPCQ